MAVCMDGSRLSGDMYSAGAVATDRTLASAIALNTPSAGSHAYSLCYKTDPGTGSSSPTLSMSNTFSEGEVYSIDMSRLPVNISGPARKPVFSEY
jgi:hypothetical protein